MVTERIDGADWPPGCESDAGYVDIDFRVGCDLPPDYYGVRVGGSVEVVEPTLPEPWTWGVHKGRWVARSEHYGTRVGADVPRSHYYDGIGCTDRVCQMVDERNRRSQTFNPWRKFGLNAREYGWHMPRGRA